jgi:hypothetical protein
MPTTITNIYELPQGEYSEGQQDGDWRAVRSWVVELSEPDGDGKGAEIAKGAQGIPAKGALYPDSSNARFICQRIAVKLHNNSRRAYRVDCEYGITSASTGGGTSGTGQSQSVPWQRDKMYSYTTSYVEEDLEYDFSTPQPKRIVNSAGDLFDAPLVYQRPLPQITIEWAARTSGYNRAAAGRLVGSTNDSSVTIDGSTYLAGECKLVESSVNLLEWTDPGGITLYYAIRQVIVVNENLWDKTLVSRGYRYRDNQGDLKRCYDIDGDGQQVPSASPKFLDDSGMQIDPTEQTPAEETFIVLPPKSWGALSLS